MNDQEEEEQTAKAAPTLTRETKRVEKEKPRKTVGRSAHGRGRVRVAGRVGRD